MEAHTLDDKATAQMLNDELYHLYCSGPSAGGGIRKFLIPQMATASVMVPREAVSPRVEVIAFPRNTAKSLLEAAERFQPLDRKFMIYRRPPRPSRAKPAPPKAEPAGADGAGD